jgi:S1-C subfamily serine protease
LDDWPWHIPLDLMILPAQAGSSGGAVFNASGEVVGILVGGVNCALFVYVPVSQIVLQESSPAIVGKTP